MLLTGSVVFFRLALLWGLVAVAAGCAARGPAPRPFPLPPAREPPAGTAAPAAAGDEDRDPASNLLGTALSLRGVPYRPGGSTPQEGFDCSGLVAWVFGQHGVSVPRTVGELFTHGSSVGPAVPLVRGDLVFFATERSGPSHVGIALGDGRFVHAPNARSAVRVDDITGPYWIERYLGARRVLDQRAPP